MKRSPRQMMEYLNQVLTDNNQQTQVTTYSKVLIELTNGLTYRDRAAQRWVRRLTKSKLWAPRFDDIVNGIITEQEVKAICARKGGINCQAKHGDKIIAGLQISRKKRVYKKGRQPYHYIWNEEERKQISKRHTGSGNPMYGKSPTPEARQKQSSKLKAKILSGEFTPNIKNSRTHWNTSFDGKSYRSSWEALYQLIDPEAKFEALRIPYMIGGKQKIYIVDFINHVNKQCIEVKPKEHSRDPLVMAKLDALKLWCASNGYSVVIADQDYLVRNIALESIDFSRFDDGSEVKIKEMYARCKSKRNSEAGKSL